MSTSINILFIEDNPADFRLVVRHLEKHGLAAHCHCVSTVEELEAAVEKGGWDIVLSDYSVPKLSFLHVLSLLQTRHPDLPVILISGSVGEEKAVELLKMGVWDFVFKDNLSRLVPAIERSLKDAADRIARRESEAALHQSEEQFRAMFETAAIGMAQADLDTGQWLRVNQRMCAITGYSADELLQKRISEITHIEDRKKDWEAFQRVVRGEAPDYRLEKRYVRKDGRTVWVNVNMTVIRDAAGQPLHTMATIEDISERKLAERSLQDSERRLHMALDAGHMGVWEYDFEAAELYWSPDLFKTFGIPEMRPSRDLLLSITHPDDVNISDAAMGKALREHGTYHCEYRVILGDKTIWVEDHGTILRDEQDRPVKVIGTAQDVTERKRAEAEIQRLAQVVEQATESIVITDTEGTIQYVNPAFEKVTGYTRQEAIGQNPRILKSGKHDDAFFKNLWETIRRGDVWRGHLVNKRKDGTLFEEDAVISPVRDAAGAITSFAAVKDDMTLQMRLEQHLQQTQKLDGIGRLAGGVAHDFNNILTATLMHLSLLMDDARVDKTLRKDLKGLEAQALRAAALTRQLLLFSRRTVMQVIPLQLNEAVTNLMKMLGRILGEDIRTEFQFGNNLPLIEADAGMMEQVITNLAVNARDAMPKGGKLIFATYAVSISKEEALQHPKRRPGRFASLAVTDTGCGMDEKTMARIFEPFFTTKEVGKGTGLGLATVYGIIQQHSGWIEVASEVGKGSTFTIFLPVMEDASARETKSGAAAPVLGGNETILLVEDEARVRKMLSTFLTRLGYCVLEASRGYEARDVWHQNGGAIDLLFTDMVMPGGLTGLELAESLRSQKPSLRVIISSGYSADLAGHDDLSAKGFRFAPKPCLPRELAALVRTCLDAKP